MSKSQSNWAQYGAEQAQGGAGEIGMNAYVYGYGTPGRERLILVDLGVSFGDMDSSPGIDLIMPDLSWLEQNRDRLEAIFITHGHEDHIGALPFLLRLRSDIPVVGDWDGNGVTDVGVRRGTTFIKRMADGKTYSVSFGGSDDKPVTGDWNADTIADVGVYNSETGTFTLRILGKDWVSRSYTVKFGKPGSVAVTGDWDDNGYTDLGVWDPNTSTFHGRIAARPTGGTFSTESIQFGRAKG